jgi:TPR repeat protein
MNKILPAILTILCLCNCLNGLAESLDDIRRKAEAGDVHAQLILGYLYDSGEGVPRNHKEAAKWYHKAAGQGNAPAQNHLGGMYAIGRGVPRNDKEAVKWWHKAAEQGVASAQNNLAVRFVVGKGVPKDFVSAYAWYSVAAQNGFKGSAQKRDSLAKVMSRDQVTRARAMGRDLRNRIDAKKKAKK